MTKDRPKPCEWYRRAADRGYGAGQYQVMAFSMPRASGVAGGLVQARDGIPKAAAGGYAPAKKWLDQNPQ